MADVAVVITDNLHFDVPWVLEESLEVDAGVVEVGLALADCLLQFRLDLGGIVGDLEARGHRRRRRL